MRSVRSVLLLLLMSTGGARAETLSLEAALSMAYDRSPAMLQARHSLEISRRNLRAQKAALRSNFGLVLTPYQYARDRVFNDLVSRYNTQEQTHLGATLSMQQPIARTDGTLSVEETVGWREASSSFTGDESERTYSSGLQVRLHQPLFTYNRTRLQLQELELARERSQLQYAIQKLQIQNQVVRQYMDVYLQARSVDIARQELANARERLEIIRSKVDAGIAAVEELYQAALDEANSRASLQDAELVHANGLDALRLSLGLDLTAPLTVAAAVGKQLVPVDLAHAVENGLAQRMELRQLDIDIQNAANDLVRTGAQNEFYGSLDLSYGVVGTAGAAGDLFDDPTRNQRVAVMLNVPLFDWGEQEQREAASAERLASRRQDAAAERRRIEVEIRQAFRSVRNQELRIEIAERNVENAQLTYAINLERYRNGDLSSKDMNFYQNQLSREQLNEARALIDYRLALLDLKLRTLWDFERDAPVQVLDE